MRISTLLQREPFGTILEQTLADFLSKHFNQTFLVSWRHQGVFPGSKGCQTWLCNPYLNIIFRPGVNREPLLPAINEFSRSVKPWRTPMNRLYVKLATSHSTARFMSNATVEIEPWVPNAEEMVIIGGNHHIRILDYCQRNCTVITKHGFRAEFMQNEIAVRCAHTYLPSPRILANSGDGRWYTEDLILGTPINRLNDQLQAGRAVQQIVMPLFRLYEETQKSEHLHDYVEGIVARIDQYLGRNQLLTISQREGLISAVQGLTISASEGHGSILTVQAHGDFQPANILVGDGGPWLIDWEYTMRRQAGYDGLVYALSSRNSSGLAQRVRKAFDGKLPTDALLADWPGIEWQDYRKRKAILALFFLEELELKLIENDNLIFTSLDLGLQNLCQEIEYLHPLFSVDN